MYARRSPQPSPRSAGLAVWKAPTAGLIANRNLAIPQGPDGRSAPGAQVLENFFPTATGIVMRRGSEVYATLEEGEDPSSRPPVLEFMTYNRGGLEQMFAATETAIYDVTNPVAITKVFDGLSGADWSYTQFATSGGTFLVAVNGIDDMMLYDGTRWYPIGATGAYTLAYDALVDGPFVAGQSVTGGTSGASATIRSVTQITSTTGVLVLTGLVGGPFQNNEQITSGLTVATADGASALQYPGITGIGTANLSYVWSFKNRLLFVEKNSMSAWYLGIDAITGTATEFPLGGVFSLGGSLLFGSSWSVESGDGLEARCIFVTDGGEEGAEIAVYAGSNPSDVNYWMLVGVYRTGKPLGKTAHVRAGGDVVIATDLGFIPVSVSVTRDFAALSPSAISYAIEDDWFAEVRVRSQLPWKCKTWPAGRITVVALPTGTDAPPKWFVVNVRTGAWAVFTGWDANCIAVFGDRLFFGSQEGKIVEANVTGFDQGATYSATCVPLFEDLGSPASLKVPGVARAVIRAPIYINSTVTMQHDYVVDLPPPPDASPTPPGSTWGTGIWGVSTWGQEAESIVIMDWVSVGGRGYALSPAVQMTSGSLTPVDAELVRIESTIKTTEIVS